MRVKMRVRVRARVTKWVASSGSGGSKRSLDLERTFMPYICSNSGLPRVAGRIRIGIRVGCFVVTRIGIRIRTRIGIRIRIRVAIIAVPMELVKRCVLLCLS